MERSWPVKPWRSDRRYRSCLLRALPIAPLLPALARPKLLESLLWMTSSQARYVLLLPVAVPRKWFASDDSAQGRGEARRPDHSRRCTQACRDGFVVLVFSACDMTYFSRVLQARPASV